MEFEEITLSSDRLFDGKVIKLNLDSVRLPDGGVAQREYVCHRGGAAVLAVDDGCALFVKQFRYPYKETLLEIPAGKLEEGELPAVTAARELEEETGLKAGRLEEYGVLYPTPGYTNEKLYIYLAKDVVQGKAHPDSDEFVEPVRIPVFEALDMVKDGRIKDAKTCYALMRYALDNSKKA